MTKLLLEYSLTQSFTDKVFVTFGVAKALALAAFTWWLCGFSMWLWNRRFKLRFIHHFFCALAALVTLLAIFTWQCVGELQRFADGAIKKWGNDYLADNVYHRQTYLQAFDALQQYYQEHGKEWDYTNFPSPPRDVESWNRAYNIPGGDPQLDNICYRVYADRAIDHLRKKEDLLSQILWHDGIIDIEPLRTDEDQYHANHPGNPFYPLVSGTVRMTAEMSVAKLNREVEQKTRALRFNLVLAFVVAQSIAFGLAARSAYSDLKLRSR